MRRARFVLHPNLEPEELAAYHDDFTASLYLYFSPAAPTFRNRFAGYSADEIASELQSRLLESDVRSSLAVLTSLEAHFQTDFNVRCRRRLKDPLSVHFRSIERTRRDRVRLDEDILDGWRKHSNASGTLIGQVRAAFKFRHWLAHGRYYSPKLGQKYDFDGLYLMSITMVSAFQFQA